jgi:hypothetical protein
MVLTVHNVAWLCICCLGALLLNEACIPSIRLQTSCADHGGRPKDEANDALRHVPRCDAAAAEG